MIPPSRRVLHVAHTTELGLGTAARMAADQAARGWDVTVACSDDAAARSWRERWPEVRHVAWNAVRGPGPGTPREIAALRAIIRETAPDLIHLHSSKAGMAGRLLLRGRIPTVFQPHAWSFEAVGGPVRRAAAAWERRAARWADVILCVSEAERSRGVEAGVRGRLRVIPNGIDVEALRPATDGDRIDARRRLGLDPSRPLVVCVGRLSRQKGQDVLLAAWPRVRRDVPAADLVLVGDGPDRAVLEGRGVDGVRFAGLRDDVPDWLAASDLVALPSRWEGMPLVVLEAMARGRSVVAADADGVREALPVEAGAIVPMEDPAALATAVSTRLDDPAGARAEGETGRRHVEAHHDLRANLEGVAGLYDEVLATRASRTPR
ncbi:MAG TPA: glycosyltransferase family 4 protein [Actinomycetota bacterium]